MMEFHLVPAADIAIEPLDVGPDSKVNLVDVIDRTQGAPFCAGILEVFPGAPVDFDYDDDAAACYMLEGEITLSENGESKKFLPGDVVYIPQKKGLLVYWSTETYGKIFYVTYPPRPLSIGAAVWAIAGTSVACQPVVFAGCEDVALFAAGNVNRRNESITRSR